MKKATLIIWAIITVIIAIVFKDNWDFFKTPLSLSIRFVEKTIPPLPVCIYFIIFFFFGFIIAYLFNFSSRFKAKRTTKKLNAAIASHQEEVSALKGELDSLKGLETPPVEQAVETKTKTDADAIIELTGDSLVENPADQPGKSSIDNQEVKPAMDSEDKSSKNKS